MAQALVAIKEMREKQQVLVTQARAELDKVTDTATAEERTAAETAHDRAMSEFDTLQGKIDREMKLIEAEERMNPRDPRRPIGDDRSIIPANDAEARNTAFRSFLRYGRDGMTAEERALIGPQRTMRDGADGREERAQGVNDATAGGYTVPQGFMDELIVAQRAYGPMADPGVCREIVTATGNMLPWPGVDDTAQKGRRIGENVQAAPAAQIAFNVRNLFAYKYTTDVCLVSSELLQDSAVNPEGVVRELMAERFGRVLNDDLTLGTGADMPVGLQYAAVSGYTAAASAAITFDDLIELEHSLDPAYRSMPGVAWMFHDTTLKALRKLKDGDGQYIWQPASVTANAPATISGYKYRINQSFPTIATGVKSVVFGDFNRYVVRRVKELLIRRLVERYADNDQVGFIGFARYDGTLADRLAVKALTHP